MERICSSQTMSPFFKLFFFFFNDTATTEIYTLSLHDALPIYPQSFRNGSPAQGPDLSGTGSARHPGVRPRRSEEHTSELQSRLHLVCRLLLEKKKNYNTLGSTPPSQ